jgi:integrase
MTDKPIIKQSTRILTPTEWYRLREHLTTKYQVVCDVLLNTGMRVEEFWEFNAHTYIDTRNDNKYANNWFSASRRCIDLPECAIGKARCTIKQRTILLSPNGVQAVETLISMNSSIKYTDRSNMRKMLINSTIAAGLDPKGITNKMFRKTLVSWLMATVPEKEAHILYSIGHSQETQHRHYLSMGFVRRDVEDMRKFLYGWGEA